MNHKSSISCMIPQVQDTSIMHAMASANWGFWIQVEGQGYVRIFVHADVFSGSRLSGIFITWKVIKEPVSSHARCCTCTDCGRAAAATPQLNATVWLRLPTTRLAVTAAAQTRSRYSCCQSLSYRDTQITYTPYKGICLVRLHWTIQHSTCQYLHEVNVPWM